MMQLMLRASFCVMALLALGAQSAEHVVAESSGHATWHPGTYADLAVAVGDTLVFNYNIYHDVTKMSDSTCGKTGNTELAGSNVGGGSGSLVNKYTYTVTSADQTAGTIYFSCSKSGGSYSHCESGQKLTVTVPTEHVVTQSSGSVEWKPGSYTALAATVGDTLVFNYDENHDVIKMSDDTCSTNTGNIELAKNSVGGGSGSLANKFTYTVTSEDLMSGTIYFSCSYSPMGSYSHCASGQKLNVTVHEHGIGSNAGAGTTGGANTTSSTGGGTTAGASGTASGTTTTGSTNRTRVQAGVVGSACNMFSCGGMPVTALVTTILAFRCN